MFEEVVRFRGKPAFQVFPLTGTWKVEVGSTVLGANISVGIEGNPQVGPVDFFFDDELMPEKCLRSSRRFRMARACSPSLRWIPGPPNYRRTGKARME